MSSFQEKDTKLEIVWQIINILKENYCILWIDILSGESKWASILENWSCEKTPFTKNMLLIWYLSIREYWFYAKNLSPFLFFPWKLNSPYYHIVLDSVALIWNHCQISSSTRITIGGPPSWILFLRVLMRHWNIRKCQLLYFMTYLQMLCYTQKSILHTTFITSKSSSKHLSNEKKHWCFCCL